MTLDLLNPSSRILLSASVSIRSWAATLDAASALMASALSAVFMGKTPMGSAACTSREGGRLKSRTEIEPGHRDARDLLSDHALDRADHRDLVGRHEGERITL